MAGDIHILEDSTQNGGNSTPGEAPACEDDESAQVASDRQRVTGSFLLRGLFSRDRERRHRAQ